MKKGTQPIKGVELITKKSGDIAIRVKFQFQGKQHKITIPGLNGNLKKDIAKANSIKSAVNLALAERSFDYAEFFPYSKHVKDKAKNSVNETIKSFTVDKGENCENETFKVGSYTLSQKFNPEKYDPLSVPSYLCQYLISCIKRNLSPSTIKGYKTCIAQLSPLYQLSVTEIKAKDLKHFVMTSKLSYKSLANIFSLLRPAVNEAVVDDVIKHNPCLSFKHTAYQVADNKVNLDGKNEDIDPFTPQEISLLLSSCEYQQDKNLARFGFETGLRSSELCALRWSNIDIKNKKIRVTQALVEKTIKGTKTKRGTRIVDLSPLAVEALENQREYTQLQNGYVFHNPRTGKHWQGANQIRKSLWLGAIERSGVRYRYPYQMRHTFASIHISKGNCDYFWLANQMGHKGPEMIFNHYGFYILQHDPNPDKYFDLAK